jgi:hypothetical protein
MDLNENVISPTPIIEEMTAYEQALHLFRQGHHLYTNLGRPELLGWQYENALYCFHRAVLALTDQATTPEARTLLLNAQYYLYKSFYTQTLRGTQLGKRLRILSVEAALSQSPVRRHRVATRIVEYASPFEKIGIRLLDLYDRLRPTK